MWVLCVVGKTVGGSTEERSRSHGGRETMFDSVAAMLWKGPLTQRAAVFIFFLIILHNILHFVQLGKFSFALLGSMYFCSMLYFVMSLKYYY